MLEFTQTLLIEDKGYLHFTFNSINSPQKQKFHVTVLTRGPQCHHFNMEENSGHWKIVAAPKPPDWILGLEPKLGLIIQQQLSTGYTMTKDLNVA